MFVLKTDHEFEWPVTVRVPVDGGIYASQTFKVRYRLPADDEMKQMLRTTGDDAVNARKVVAGWSEVKNEHGDDVPFSDELLDKFLRVPWIRVAIWQTFIDASFGIVRKNS